MFSPWALRLTAAAVAACLMLLTYLAQPESSRSDRTARTSLAGLGRLAPVSVSVCHEPSLVAEDARRIDHFQATSDAGCVVVAVFRAWDEACQCLNWRLHEWDEAGRTLAELDPDQLLDIALDVTGNPPVGQLLVLATSRTPGDLPATSDDAAALLQCLNEVAPPICSDGDVRSFASAVGECLPSSVMLVEETFFVD